MPAFDGMKRFIYFNNESSMIDYPEHNGSRQTLDEPFHGSSRFIRNR